MLVCVYVCVCVSHGVGCVCSALTQPCVQHLTQHLTNVYAYVNSCIRVRARTNTHTHTQFTNALCSLASVILYVWLTYSEYPGIQSSASETERIRIIDQVQSYLNFFFLLDFLLRLYVSENRKHFLMSTLVLIDLATIFPQLVVWCIFTSGVIEWGSVRQVFPITVQPDFLVTCVQCVLDCIVYMTASQCVFTCLKTGRQTDARARATDVQLPSTRIDLHACMPIYMPCSTQHVARTRRGSSACCISSNSQRCSA